MKKLAQGIWLSGIVGMSALPARADKPASALVFTREIRSHGNPPPPAGLQEYREAIKQLSLAQGKDPAPGVELLHRGDEKGFSPATYALGVLHAFGQEGVPQNAAEGLRLIRKAAAAGNANAQFTLGKLMGSGVGMSKQPRLALILLRGAESGGVLQAKEGIRELKGQLALPGGVPDGWADLEDCRLVEPYPSKALPKAWEKEPTSGLLVMALEVDSAGNVVLAQEVFGRPELVKEGLELARQLHFKPRMAGGVPQPFKTLLSIRLIEDHSWVTQGRVITTETYDVLPGGILFRH
ncbi:MAG TPA: hypothetical protein VJ623_08875 [Holophagaceae bacterium]|nr:hypothetical protein [Holophagaceae bacterium]